MIKVRARVWDPDSNELEAAAAAGTLVEVFLLLTVMERDGPSS